MSLNIALIGFGTVGSAIYKLVQTKKYEFKSLLGESPHVTDIVIKDSKKNRAVDNSTGVRVTTDFGSVINGNIDVVIEAIVGVEPAFTFLSKALRRGIPVITANKELFAKKGSELEKLARQSGTTIEYEATVAGGIPIIRTLKELLNINHVTKIEGILNGTANFILTDMRVNNHAFEKSLQLAQSKGYAEADPSNDILGTDAFYKLMILSQTIYGKVPNWDEVQVKGIDKVNSVDVEIEALRGNRFKLIAELTKDDVGDIKASIEPKLLDSEHPLYGVEGVDNAIAIYTDLLGTLTLKGPGAGGDATASAIFTDLNTLTTYTSKKQISAISI